MSERRTTREAELFTVLDRAPLCGLNDALARLLARFEQEFGNA